ncbi:MAG TPA: hypothetical protein VGH56_05940, partial [Solirubrobacteraceae bacterium]
MRFSAQPRRRHSCGFFSRNSAGVSRRTLTGWLAQAWSRDERDQKQVELVKTLVRGEKAYGAIGRRLT